MFRRSVALSALVSLSLQLCPTASESAVSDLQVLIPEYQAQGEVYLCTRVSLPDAPQRLISVQPLSKQEVVHHMLLYGELVVRKINTSTEPLCMFACHLVCACQKAT